MSKTKEVIHSCAKSAVKSFVIRIFEDNMQAYQSTSLLVRVYVYRNFKDNYERNFNLNKGKGKG